MTRAWTALLLVTMIAAPAHAQRSGARDEEEARRTYARCGEAEGFEAPPVLTAEDSEWGVLDITRHGALFLVSHYYWGNGVEASYGGWRELLDPRSCAQLRYEWAGSGNSSRADGELRWRNRGAPSEEELRDLAAERGRPGDPAHAFAQLRLAQRCDELPEITSGRAWELAGPITPAQPWLPGRPATPVDTFWPDAQQEPGTLRGVEVPAPISSSAAWRVRRIGGLELWSAAVQGRNGAQVIAVYDPRADLHRWLVATIGCIYGTEIRWLGHEGSLVIGVTRSRHPAYQWNDGVLVLDLARGLAFRWEPSFSPAQEGPPLAELVRGPHRARFFRALAGRVAERAASPAWMPAMP